MKTTNSKKRRGCRGVENKSPIWILQYEADSRRRDSIMFYYNIVRGMLRKEQRKKA